MVETDILVEENKASGQWMWAFRITDDRGTWDYAAGQCDSKQEAQENARDARRTWEDRNS